MKLSLGTTIVIAISSSLLPSPIAAQGTGGNSLSYHQRSCYRDEDCGPGQACSCKADCSLFPPYQRGGGTRLLGKGSKGTLRAPKAYSSVGQLQQAKTQRRRRRTLKYDCIQCGGDIAGTCSSTSTFDTLRDLEGMAMEEKLDFFNENYILLDPGYEDGDEDDEAPSPKRGKKRDGKKRDGKKGKKQNGSNQAKEDRFGIDKLSETEKQNIVKAREILDVVIEAGSVSDEALNKLSEEDWDLLIDQLHTLLPEEWKGHVHFTKSEFIDLWLPSGDQSESGGDTRELAVNATSHSLANQQLASLARPNTHDNLRVSTRRLAIACQSDWISVIGAVLSFAIGFLISSNVGNAVKPINFKKWFDDAGIWTTHKAALISIVDEMSEALRKRQFITYATTYYQFLDFFKSRLGLGKVLEMLKQGFLEYFESLSYLEWSLLILEATLFATGCLSTFGSALLLKTANIILAAGGLVTPILKFLECLDKADCGTKIDCGNSDDLCVGEEAVCNSELSKWECEEFATTCPSSKSCDPKDGFCKCDKGCCDDLDCPEWFERCNSSLDRCECSTSVPGVDCCIEGQSECSPTTTCNLSNHLCECSVAIDGVECCENEDCPKEDDILCNPFSHACEKCLLYDCTTAPLGVLSTVAISGLRMPMEGPTTLTQTEITKWESVARSHAKGRWDANPQYVENFNTRFLVQNVTMDDSSDLLVIEYYQTITYASKDDRLDLGDLVFIPFNQGPQSGLGSFLLGVQIWGLEARYSNFGDVRSIGEVTAVDSHIVFS